MRQSSCTVTIGYSAIDAALRGHVGGAEPILAAVQRIHEAPLIVDGWNKVLPSIAAATGSDRVCLLVQNATSKAVEFASGFEFAPQHLTAVAAAMESGSIPNWILDLPAGIPLSTSSAMSDRDFARSDFYNEVLQPMRVFYGLALAPLSTRQTRVYFVADRHIGRENYDGQDVTALQWLAPHMATALQISGRLAAVDLRAAGACCALDHLNTGVILVDANAGILFANRMAEAVMARKDGLRIEKGAVGARDPRAHLALRRAIAGCAEISLSDRCPGRRIEIGREDGRSLLSVTVAPYCRDAAESGFPVLGPLRSVAILLIADLEQERRTKAERLRRQFGLTAAEVDVALEILKGDGREAAAARLRISVATVRTHLIRIFEKTGVRRQAELVRLLLQDGPDTGGA